MPVRAPKLLAFAWSVIAKIGLYHLCEEFSHMRLFQEMFRTFHLDKVEWVPLGKWMSRMYRLFPMFPEAMLAPPAFVSELMGLTVYQHIDGVLDDILADEPEARERVRTLLREVMTDELAHVGQRRNFLGPIGLRARVGFRPKRPQKASVVKHGSSPAPGSRIRRSRWRRERSTRS